MTERTVPAPGVDALLRMREIALKVILADGYATDLGKCMLRDWGFSYYDWEDFFSALVDIAPSTADMEAVWVMYDEPHWDMTNGGEEKRLTLRSVHEVIWGPVSDADAAQYEEATKHLEAARRDRWAAQAVARSASQRPVRSHFGRLARESSLRAWVRRVAGR